jgi:hypothetical protein
MFTRIELSEDGEPLQTVDLGNEQFMLEVKEIADIEKEKPHLVQPFNIYGDRLFHVSVMHDAEHYYLFLDYHHIIVDGTSMQLLLHDIERAYNNEALEPEAMSMAQIALDEAQKRQQPEFEEAKKWYATTFDCGDTFTQFMPDLEETEHSEDHLLRTLSLDLGRVDDYCKQNGVFKSTLFTTAYAFLLAKFNNEQESLFTTVYNGRSDKRFARSVGMTVKTLPVYTKFTPETTVLDLLLHGQEQMGGCRQHEAYTYSDLMTDLNLQSNSMFAWHGQLFDNETMELKTLAPVFDNNRALFPELDEDQLAAPEWYIEHCRPKLGRDFIITARGLLTDAIRADLEALRGFRFINHRQHPISENRLSLLDSLVRHQLERILE